MKKRLFLLPFFLLSLPVLAQPFGNEWIRYDQQYYRIKIWNDGVYRIPRNVLLAAVPALQSVDPRNVQLFGRGEEQYIYIEGEEDGSWDDGDYIEFFGRKNDGWLDNVLYPTAEDQTNPYFSLFTDTAVYYLTWNASTGNRRMSVETDVNFSGQTAAPWFMNEVISQLTSSYYFGRTNANNSTDCEYTNGEGWSGPSFSAPRLNQTTNLPSTNAVGSGPAANLTISYKTISTVAGTAFDHRYQLQLSTRPVTDTLLKGHGSRRFSLSMPASGLGSSTTPYRFSYVQMQNNLGQNITSNSVLSHYVWRYPHNYNLENRTFFRMFIPDNASGNRYQLNITNFNAENSTARLYDLSNHRRIPVVLQGSTQRAIVPNGDSPLKECYLTADAHIISLDSSRISEINYVAGQPGRFTNYTEYPGVDFMIISHPSLRDGAEQYKQYRSQRFNTGLFFVNELYEQFAYGIEQHPLSIRNFIRTALESWTEKPEYLLLLGKSVSAHNIRNSPTIRPENQVPTFGFPSSDNLFSAGLGQSLAYEQGLATGRVSAKNNPDLVAYLNKMIEYESAEPALWMKQVMHFSGGSSSAEQQTFLNYLNNYKRIIEDTLFGGTVFTYQKTTTAPIEQTQSTVIANHINNGVSLMTFFGHASGTGFDVSIDNPANYNNQGKYPFLIGNSCFAGDIHQPAGLGFSQSEEFTLIPNRGTIGFIASVSLGIPSQLNVYTDSLYRIMCRRYYGQPMGMNMKRAARAVHSMDQLRKSLLLEMTYHGDPGIVMNSQLLPDYATSVQDVYFSPTEVTTEVDSFSLNIIISNRGRAIRQPVQVEVIRHFPGQGDDTTYTVVMNELFYLDTLSIRMPVTHIIKGGVGINSFSIRIDPLNQYEELSELNNDVNVQLIIRSAEVLPIWPYDFALVPNNTVTLKASTGDPFAPVRDYVFELDTTDLFNSPFKIRTAIRQAGGVISWTPPIVLRDSMVYFWRVAPDSVAGVVTRWRESSFQHIRGKRGWSQDHFFQFKKDRFNLIRYDRGTRYFDFLRNAKQLSVNTYGYPWTADELWAVAYKIDADVISYAGCSLDGAVYIAVFDSVTLQPWYSPKNCPNEGNQYGQYNSTCGCKGQRMGNFIFRSEGSGSAGELTAMRDMINQVPDGHYVLAYTWIYGKFQAWDPSVWEAFENLGAQQVRNLPNEYPWIFFAQKGDPSSAVELVADSANANLSLSVPLYNSWFSGDLTSTLIGPGSGWDTLSWTVKGFDNPKDSIRIQVIGIRPNGAEDVIIEALSGARGDVNLSPVIGERNYRYLRLNAFMRDDSVRTPVQLDRWQVTFDEVPEAALNPLAGHYFHNSTIQQGDSLRWAIAIQNISELPMDSMLVAYWIQDAGRNIIPIEYHRQKALPPGDILYDTLSVSTLALRGQNTIWVEANPNFDQPEQFHFNNIGSLTFNVGTDNINPLLDVTFDGVHILNGDIISPKPEILIQLRDENPYLALDDTASFRLFLRRPQQSAAQPVYFSKTPELVFYPADLPANKARIEFRPVFTEDGTYDLIVRARDRSGNVSGSVEYKISFEVVNRSTITNIFNYPNPFSTKTHFVFTLTGSEIPDHFRIRIMTITGKVVKDIRRDELGSIRIGRNMTEYYWDGRDEFGDLLANGVYLYHVTTSINGEDIERRETAGDKYFMKGYGKMYLMR